MAHVADVADVPEGAWLEGAVALEPSVRAGM